MTHIPQICCVLTRLFGCVVRSDLREIAKNTLNLTNGDQDTNIFRRHLNKCDRLNKSASMQRQASTEFTF